MAGIYIHIPFCRQACHYCNFHFTTSLRRKNELVAALLKELEIQRTYLQGEPVETIYFGGGTPSLLSGVELQLLMDRVHELFPVAGDAECTFEVNPDDVTPGKVDEWLAAGINRLSLGIQSFHQADLEWMNRAHTVQQAHDAIQAIQRGGITNFTIDLIYGGPTLGDETWRENINTALSYAIPHLSCYALTVEEKTPLYKYIREHQKSDVDPDRQAIHFEILVDMLEKAGYRHYEISNFAKPGFESRHNTSYWEGKKYLGIGPSAHSFNGSERQWNVSNNATYINKLEEGQPAFEKEVLTAVDRLNEYIMTSLRTDKGIDLAYIQENWGMPARVKLVGISRKYVEQEWVREENGRIILRRAGKFLADGLAAGLFFDQR